MGDSWRRSWSILQFAQSNKDCHVASGFRSAPGDYGESAEEWLDKLRRYTQASELVIRPNPKKAGTPEAAMQAEGERILKAVNPQVSRCPLLVCMALN